MHIQVEHGIIVVVRLKRKVKKMIENEIITPYKVAVIIDGEVAETISCDERSWALYTSNPTFVDITDNPFSLIIGQSYNE